MNSKFSIGISLYALLGFALSAIGINPLENPASFFTILIVVLAIDMNGNRA